MIASVLLSLSISSSFVNAANIFKPMPTNILSTFQNLTNGQFGTAQVYPGNNKYNIIYDANGYSSFLLDQGVNGKIYVVDCPETLSPNIVTAIKKLIGDRNVDYFIYTHAHKDHAEGIDKIVGAYPNMIIVAHSKVNQILYQKADVGRPVASLVVYDNGYKFPDGVELSFVGEFHSVGDLILKVDDVSYSADLINPGWTPYYGLAKTINAGQIKNTLVTILGWSNINTYVCSHYFNYIAKKQHIQMAIDYLDDLQKSIFSGFQTIDYMKVVGESGVDTNNAMAMTYFYEKAVIDVCINKMLGIWNTTGANAASWSYPSMAAVDTAIQSNCQTSFWYTYMSGADGSGSKLVLSGIECGTGTILKNNQCVPVGSASKIYSNINTTKTISLLISLLSLFKYYF